MIDDFFCISSNLFYYLVPDKVSQVNETTSKSEGKLILTQYIITFRL